MSASNVKIVEKAGDLLNTIVPNIQKTADLVEEISSSSKEQTIGTDQVNKAIQQLDQVIQQNAMATEEMASTAEELASQANQMSDIIKFFKLDLSTKTDNSMVLNVPSPHEINRKKNGKSKKFKENLQKKNISHLKLLNVENFDDDFIKF